jgi:prepilin-type N-terminal cleavage/methylation domain-containing protein
MWMVWEERESRKHGAGGFTLTELLVVVSIICLLMSLSLPALTQAHRQAEQIHCLANEHQLMLAWLLYAPDYDDKLCRADSWTSPPQVVSPLGRCPALQDG